jgi:hypothetical protein
MKLIDRALDNPSATFQLPRNVVDRQDLTREEKIEILRRWEYESRLQEVAQEENMIASRPGMLSQVLDALSALDAPRRPSAPTKGGGA